MAIVIAGRCLRMYLCLFCWDNDLIASHPELDRKLIALEEEIVDNAGYLVELLDIVFDLITNAYSAPIIQAITTALVADHALH